MLEKLEKFPELQPTKPLSIKIEKFLRQYDVTDFACNSFLETLLLATGITEVKPLGISFLNPDFVRVAIMLESAELAKIEQFYVFSKQQDSTSTLEKTQINTYAINLDCTTCLEKIVPIFEPAFLERIKTELNCLKNYQEESAIYYAKYLEEKSTGTEIKATQSTPTTLSDKTRILFLNPNSKKPDPTSNDEQITLGLS